MTEQQNKLEQIVVRAIERFNANEAYLVSHGQLELYKMFYNAAR